MNRRFTDHDVERAILDSQMSLALHRLRTKARSPQERPTQIDLAQRFPFNHRTIAEIEA